ncbi:hypothetical protein JW930_07525 [Candidatus Woesearchaeota archaeon]|nr:hypothetical protein [Candidatus Woesearchaeota archaeon]
MGYIRKNTTLILLFLLIVALLVYGGSTVYYQKSLTKLNQNLADKDTQIETLTGTLQSLESNHTRLEELLNMKVQREMDLTDQYEDVKSEKEILFVDKLSVERELNTTKRELNIAMLNISILIHDMDELRVSYDELEADYSEIYNDTIGICEDAEDLNITECEDYLE